MNLYEIVFSATGRTQKVVDLRLSTKCKGFTFCIDFCCKCGYEKQI